MDPTDFTSRSPEETATFGERLAGRVQAGDCIGLIGDLGAGKTLLVQGLVRGLGAGDRVTSPTFTLVNEYRTGRIPVFHFDFYRMRSSAEVEEIGWWEYLDRGGLIVAEWADMFPELFPGRADWWSLSAGENGMRRIVQTTRPFGDDFDDFEDE